MAATTALWAVEPGEWGFTDGLPAGLAIRGLPPGRDAWTAVLDLARRRAVAQVGTTDVAMLQPEAPGPGPANTAASGAATLGGQSCNREGATSGGRGTESGPGTRANATDAPLFCTAGGSALQRGPPAALEHAQSMLAAGGEAIAAPAAAAAAPAGAATAVAAANAASAGAASFTRPTAMPARVPAAMPVAVATGSAQPQAPVPASPPRAPAQVEEPSLLGAMARAPFRPPRPRQSLATSSTRGGADSVAANAAASSGACEDGGLLGPTARRQFKRPRIAARKDGGAQAAMVQGLASDGTAGAALGQGGLPTLALASAALPHRELPGANLPATGAPALALASAALPHREVPGAHLPPAGALAHLGRS